MTLLKICGMRSEMDLTACREADYHGFILSSDSPRCLSVANAVRLVKRSGAKRVLVTTEANLSRVEALVKDLRPDVLQLHSRMPGWEVQEARSLVPEVWALVSMGRGGEQVRLDDLKGRCDGVVLDTASVRGGGSGSVHDWSASAHVRGTFPGKIILAGGIGAENIADAVRTVRPHIIDVSSGIEREGGKGRHLFEELKANLKRVDDEQR